MLRTHRDFVNWDVLSDIQTELERAVNELWAKDITFPCPVIVGTSSYPKLDAEVEDDKYIVRASVPGFELSELEAEITEQQDGPVLTISGKKITPTATSKTARVPINEIKQSRFSRSLLLPRGTYSKVDASLKNGILTLTIPKPTEQIPNKIKINIQ
jgi:HSP20 family protein